MYGLLVLFAGSATAYLTRFFGWAQASQRNGAPSAPFAAELRQGREQFAQAQYTKAAETFSRLALSARAAHDDRTAARVEANIGACHFALHEYRAALASFLNARRFLESLGDLSNVAVTDANIASLYYQMGDVDDGIRWLDSAIERLSGPDRRLHLAEMLIQRGVMRAQNGPMPEAEGSFREGIEAAAAAGDWKLYATG